MIKCSLLSFFFLVTSYAVVSIDIRLSVIMKIYRVSVSCFAVFFLFYISELASVSLTFGTEVA